MTTNLTNKKIALLGLGVENYAMLKFLLAKKIKGVYTICDQRNKKQLAEKYQELSKYKNVQWRLGQKFNQDLWQFDVLFRSPGWPLFCPGVLEAKKHKVKITSALNLFFEFCPTKNIIGVTGTKGKGTTASLITEIIKTSKKRVWLGGNIGIAPFSFLNKIKTTDWVVLELSSFQLEDLEHSPKIGVLTNFFPEHLAPADPNNPNYHRSLKDYWRAKLNLFGGQNKSDWAVINKNLEAKIKAEKILSKIKYFTKSNLPSKLVGEHNQENVASAVEVSKIIGLNQNVVERAIKNFSGLEHRLELVRKFKGVDYYNDSFATTPEATMTALKSFNQPIILLAGGADKKSNFKQLARAIKKRVKFVALLDGGATGRFKKDLLSVGYQPNKIKLYKKFEQAIKDVSSLSVAGDIVLLSTACASFGMFKNYKERGQQFKRIVNNLK